MSISSVTSLSSQAASQNRQNLPGDSGFAAVLQNVSGTASGGFSTPQADAVAHSFNNTPLAQASRYFRESPAQRLEDNWLSQHGITQAQFNAMSGPQKQKIIDQMRQDIETKLKQKMSGNTGSSGSPAIASVAE